MTFSRVMAIDPSLTCSGWALFDVRNLRLIGVGKIRTLPAREGLSKRLVVLQGKVEQLFNKLNLNGNDVLICEAPTTMRDPKAAFKVEQVRGIFEAVARSRQVRVPGRLNPRTVQYEVMGIKGRQLPRAEVKEIAVRIVGALYGDQITKLGLVSDGENLKRHQDIVDAILVGSLAVSRVRSAVDTDLPVEDFFDQGRKNHQGVL
ncbi:MAG: hypothetical protein D6719_12885 [Candidatus Dadabacteria bacterium]|nr:MAG: hypothetical protein D6719_12885 [Candidatus Dadabacteria bacterium]